MARPTDLLPGTLDLLILRTLQKDTLHGRGISERIQQISQDVLQINQGSLYPALHVSSTRAGSRPSGRCRSLAVVDSRSKRGTGSGWQTPSAA